MRIGYKMLLLSAALAAAMAAAAAAEQPELYRYVNRQGVVVLDHLGVPPEYVAKGYEVLNDQGRVLRVVPPAPTAEELRRRAEAKRQAEADAQLRQRYASLDDLEQARRHRLRDLDAFLGVTEANLQSVQNQLLGLERQAAEHQRAGRAVPVLLLQQMEAQRADHRRVEADLRRLQGLRRAVEAEFAADRIRLVELLGRES